MVRICKTYHFSAAHWLPGAGKGHPCYRMHGHNYKVDVICEGEVSLAVGWLVDFADMDKVMAPLIERVDHQVLNDALPLEHPTAEMLAHWFKDEFNTVLAICKTVRIWETEKCWAETA